MIRTIFIIIILSLFFVACGKKDSPEYKSQFQYNKNIYKI